MRVCFLVVISLMASIESLGQSYSDWFYFDQNWMPVSSKDRATYSRFVKQVGMEYEITQYYISNNSIEMKGACLKVFPLVLNGNVAWYHKNGSIRQRGQFVNGIKQGAFTCYYEDGSICNEVIYNKDNPKYAQYWSSDGKPLLTQGNGLINSAYLEHGFTTYTEFKDSVMLASFEVYEKTNDTIFTMLEKPAIYKKGNDWIDIDLKKKLSYPKEAKKSGIHGIVYVTVLVDKSGALNDTRVLTGLGSGFDESAMVAVNSLKKWKPGSYRGKPIKMRITIPVFF